MYPTLMVKSPNRSPGSLSKAYLLIIGPRIAKISGSVTVSTPENQLSMSGKLETTHLCISCSSSVHNSRHQAACCMCQALCRRKRPLKSIRTGLVRRNCCMLTSNIWSSTAIGTTSHPHNNSIITEAVLFTQFFYFIDQERKVLKNKKCLLY